MPSRISLGGVSIGCSDGWLVCLNVSVCLSLSACPAICPSVHLSVRHKQVDFKAAYKRNSIRNMRLPFKDAYASILCIYFVRQV